MLVLRRKKAETIVLDGRIQIKVLRISRNMISLGIEAPSDVSIWRGELELADEPTSPISPADLSAARPLVQSA
ncbi:MAG: carbon storage regulator [Candidatus Anammoximicrobium sp.]|nr:carbon storage regulator [Candidatus Anammoximicrobium sp.]